MTALIRAGDSRSQIAGPYLPIRASTPTPRSGPRPTPDSAIWRHAASEIMSRNVTSAGLLLAREYPPFGAVRATDPIARGAVPNGLDLLADRRPDLADDSTFAERMSMLHYTWSCG